MDMYFDFSAILGLLTVGTGILWALDTVFLKKGRLEKTKKVLEKYEITLDPNRVSQDDLEKAIESKGGLVENLPRMPFWSDYSRSFFPVLLLVFVLRSFLIEPFRIPSGSMHPTLVEGDFIAVNKYQYGLRLPLTGTKLINFGDPKRGDIIVFRFPNDPSVDYIKRVIGLPGDKIKYIDKQLYINDVLVPMDYVETTLDTDGMGILRTVKRYNEKLDTMTHPIYISGFDRPDFSEATVPEGQYFVMGDNRDHSLDSRSWGFVEDKLILGKAFYIWLSFDMNKKDMRWQRLGTIKKSTE